MCEGFEFTKWGLGKFECTFLKIIGHPRPLFHLFLVFSNNSANLQEINVKNDPCWDSNSKPLDHQSPPKNTGPELPPLNLILLNKNILLYFVS